MPAADPFDALLIDLDGCVWLGEDLIHGAVDAIAARQEAGTKVVFVTNDARTAASEHAERLRAAGVDVDADGVVTSASVTAKIAAEAAPGAAAVVIGTEPFREEVTAAGLSILAPDDDAASAGVVIVGGDQSFGYPELRSAVTATLAGAPLFASNRDPTLPMPDGMWPGTGAIVAAIEYATKAEAEIGGKPSPHLFREALRRLGDPEDAAMVGDRLDSDIAGAQGVGLATVLVLTGATSAEEAEAAEPRPDHVIAGLADVGGLFGSGDG